MEESSSKKTEVLHIINFPRKILEVIGKAPSTVSREVKKNGGLRKYRAIRADAKAWNRARRPKLCKLAQILILQKLVIEKLFMKWAPEQISGWLKRKYPKKRLMRISHETIYRSLYIQSRGVLKKELKKHLLGTEEWSWHTQMVHRLCNKKQAVFDHRA